MPCYLRLAPLDGNGWLLCSMPCYLGVGTLGGHSDMLCSSAFSSKVIFCIIGRPSYVTSNMVLKCSGDSHVGGRHVASFRLACSVVLPAQIAVDQPSSRIASAARRCVAFSMSLNKSSNFDMMPSGGPPSMISRRSRGIPTDISCANDSGLDSATYVASQRNSACSQWAIHSWA